jgi:hypothetical protein
MGEMSMSSEVTAETPCCTPAKAENQEWALWQSVGTLFGLIATFIVADYWFETFLESRLTGLSIRASDSLSFFISHSIGLLSLLAAITTIAVFIRSFIAR